MKILLLIWLICFAAPSAAADVTYADFKALPVLHDGRVKPLDSFARHYLMLFSSKERYDGKPAIDWLAQTLFEPGHAAESEIFTIRHPAVLGLNEDQRKISYIALSAALEKKDDAIQALIQTDPRQWNADQQALVRYHEYALVYGAMLRSLTMMLPLAAPPPAALNIKGETLTYADLQPHVGMIEQRVKQIVARKGDDPANYTEAEKEIVTFAWQLNLLGRTGEQNAFFRVIPTSGEEWLSPWIAAQDHPQRALWATLAHAWHTQDGAAWKQTTHDLRAQNGDARLTAEVIYNQFHPLGLAMALYLFVFLCASLHAIFGKTYLYRAAVSALIVAILANAIAIGLRMFILDRPPVGTLYESIIFVAMIAAMGGALFEKRDAQGRGLLAAALSGGILLFTASAFATDDTMRVLVAVLNTNFWLATHVLTITIGYGWCILTAIFAHFYLLARARGTLSAVQHVKLTRTVKSLALIALLFTTVGTILGGIWADQSWGRFWGWDPKENGALLIVLWLAWGLHGSIAGQLSARAFMACMASLTIVVALAWFGVNLLNTGLHSYGFIEGVAVSLFGFIALELLLIGGLWRMAWKRDKICA